MGVNAPTNIYRRLYSAILLAMSPPGYGSVTPLNHAEPTESRTVFRRKKVDPERRYKVETVGNLIIEKTQLPHSLTELDGTRYEIVTWTVKLRVDGGAILLERTYAKGEPEAIEKMRSVIRFDDVVEYEEDAVHKFYRDILWPWSGDM